MIVRHLRHFLIATSVAALAACGSDSDPNDNDPQPGDVGTVSGALSEGAIVTGSSSVRVESVSDSGATTIVGEGTLDANGRFEVTDVDAGDGPFVVRVVGSGDATLFAAIVPEDIGDEDTITTTRLSAETTAEVEAMLTWLEGDADTDDVDTIGLMTWITADLAASSDGDALAAAVSIAQETWLETTAEDDTAESIEEAKLSAWATFTAAVDASASASAEAWADFVAETSDVSSDAQAAAGLAFSAGFEGSAEAHEAALRVAAELSAHASFAAQRAAIAGSSVEAAVSAKLEAAYEAFFTAIAEADTEGEIDAATIDLTAAITGRGDDVTGDSALDVLIAGENDSLEGNVNAALDASADAALDFQAAVDAALSGSVEGRAAAIAQAYTTFRGELDAALDATLDASVSARLEAFTREAAAQSGAHLAALLDLDLDLLDIVGDVGLTLSGAIDVGLSGDGSDDGAIGLDGLDATFDAAASATVALLFGVNGDGELAQLDEGSISGGRFVFDGVNEATGTFIVELRDAAGTIEGALTFENITGSDSELDVGTLTQETTVETRVLIERLADGDAVDTERLALWIDAAIAGAVATDDDIDALAVATFAAELVAEANSDMNEARAEAAVTFAAIVSAMSDNSVLEDASDARAHIEGAFALQAALEGVLDGDDAAYEAQLEAALAAFVSATSMADDGGELDLAASALVSAMLGFASESSEADGFLGEFVTGALGLTIAQQLVIETALDSAFDASASLRTSLDAAIRSAVDGGGDFDASGFGSGWASLEGTFDAALDAALDLSSLTLEQSDVDVIATLVSHLSLSFAGTAR